MVVHVSAGNPFRRWPSASFVELVRRLASSRSEAPYHPHVRSIRCGGGGRDRQGCARAACRGRAPGNCRMRRVRSRGAARARRTGRALYRRRQRTAAHRRHDRRAGRGFVRTDVAGAIAAVSKRPIHQCGCRSTGSAVPSVRSAAMRARRFSVPDRNFGGSRGGARRKRTRRTDAVTLSRERRGA